VLTAALVASLLLVFAVTLGPVVGPNQIALAPWSSRQLHPVNVLGNVALFALPAAVLWFFGWSFRRTVAAGFLVSVGIEILQLAIPGRTTASADVIFNTLGAAAGWAIVSIVRRR